MLVAQRAGVIAEQSAVTFAARKPDVLLDGLFRWQGLDSAYLPMVWQAPISAMRQC